MSIVEFILSIIASVLAGVVLFAITSMLSKKARWLLTGILGRLLNIDIDAVFANKKDAVEDIQKELHRSNCVSILTSRGNELQRDTFDHLFLNRPATNNIRLRILLPQSDIPPGTYDWTAQRERELSDFDCAFGEGLLHRQVDNNVRFLERHEAAYQLELRRFNCPHIGRIILTERYAYFTPYRRNAHGRYSPIYKYRRGEMYDNFERFFDQLWNVGIDSAEECISSEAQ